MIKKIVKMLKMFKIKNRRFKKSSKKTTHKYKIKNLNKNYKTNRFNMTN